MTSQLFNMMGMGGLDPAYFFIGLLGVSVVLLILIIVLFVMLGKQKKRLNKFLQGKNAKSLEKEISTVMSDIELLKLTSEKNKNDIRILYKNMEKTFQKIGVIKYDAFNQMGGKLSFSLCLLNEKNDGFILNSVHSAEGCYSYTKEVKKGKCAIGLGEEERQALEMAMGEDAEI
ncbi:MAG: DUF4446 family protein [Lachnospiraceae bacterium]|nr:DUF4446 family protein [Lachnospiraceae bacterium]